MKTILITTMIITTLFLCITKKTFAQELTKEEYLIKNHNQKKAGFIMLGGGAVLMGSGALLVTNPPSESLWITGGFLFSIGFWTMVGSIPLFISSGINAKRAAELSLRNKPIIIPNYSGNLPRTVPSLTFSVPLN